MLTYAATLDVPEQTATLLIELLAAERLRRGTGVGARAASCLDQAVLVLRWFREDTPMPTLARDAGVSPATGYRYLHEGIDALAAHAPGPARGPRGRQGRRLDPCRPRRHADRHRPLPHQEARHRL